MRIVTMDELIKTKEKVAIAIGFFDGVHTGHQRVIEKAVSYAKSHKIKSVILTFDQRPKRVLEQITEDNYITPLKEKMRIMKELGIDYGMVLTFDDSLLQLTADEFIDCYLKKMNVCYLSVGFDFRFGHKGKGSVEDLQRAGLCQVEVSNAVELKGEKVSTTRIRKRLVENDLATANQLLGRFFDLSGVVYKGKQLGREIGFPTANIEISSEQLMPLRGVYATIIRIGDKCYASMTNVGYNPTVEKRGKISIETNVFEFSEDVYGEEIRLQFVKKIRDEETFEGLDGLIKQLEKDKSCAISILKTTTF